MRYDDGPPRNWNDGPGQYNQGGRPMFDGNRHPRPNFDDRRGGPGMYGGPPRSLFPGNDIGRGRPPMTGRDGGGRHNNNDRPNANRAPLGNRNTNRSSNGDGMFSRRAPNCRSIPGRGGAYRVREFDGEPQDARLYDLLPPFDATTCTAMFPNSHESDDAPFTEALVARNNAIKPTSVEEVALAELVNKVNAAVDKLIVAPDLFAAAKVGEVRMVGSYKSGTLLTKNVTADLVVVLTTPPTIESVELLSRHVLEDIKKAGMTETLASTPQETGFEVGMSTPPISVKVLIVTTPDNMSSLDPDLHFSEEVLQKNVRTVAHSRWADEHASHTTVKMLIRLLKDVRQRYLGLYSLDKWAIQLLAHYSVHNTPSRSPLGIAVAYRRALTLLAAGICLNGSAGIVDPCHPTSRVHHSIELKDQDLLCATAQTLMRCMSHGGYAQVLGIVGKNTLCAEATLWSGVVVTPLQGAYNEDEMYPDRDIVVMDMEETSIDPDNQGGRDSPFAVDDAPLNAIEEEEVDLIDCV